MGTKVFPRSPVAAGEARRFVTSALGKHPALDDALLCVEVGAGEACVRIDVWDDGCAGIPHLRAGDDPSAEGGRGLQLINRLAWRWGFWRSPGRTCCWAEIAAPCPECA